jgi:hypothetical protein
MSVVAPVPRTHAPLPDAGRARVIVLTVATVIGAWFVFNYAVPYVAPDALHAARYASRRVWLLVHIACGTVALLAGPVQLWLGLGRRSLGLHRRLGLAYAASVAVGSIAAFGLAAQTRLGWVFGLGLSGLGVAWLVTTGMAVLAIRRRLIVQHQEWMIRSYVVTFAFVTFRAFWGLLQAMGVGTLPEQLAAASWFCWAVPLLVTEAILQGRQILSPALHDPQLPKDPHIPGQISRT